MLSDARSAPRFAAHLRAECEQASPHEGAPGSLVVFRFDAAVAASQLGSHPDADISLVKAIHPATGSLVQLRPGVVFRFLWRRHALLFGYRCDGARVEGDALALLRHTVARADGHDRTSSRSVHARRPRRRSLACEARAILARSIGTAHPLAELARTLGVSPFHLAHEFRRRFGISIHQYLLELRLVSALDSLRAGASDLSMLALELGFSHHSHFTAHFRRAIGHSPRDVRRMLTATSVAELGVIEPPCCGERTRGGPLRRPSNILSAIGGHATLAPIGSGCLATSR